MKYKAFTKHNSLLLSMLCLILILCCFFYAPETVSSQIINRLSLQECMDIAIKRNPEIKSAKERLMKAKLQVREAYSSILPKLDTNFEYTHQHGTTSLSALMSSLYPGINYPEDNYSFSLRI